MYQEYLNFAKDIALYAGKVMMDYYQKDITLNLLMHSHYVL